MPNVSGTQDSYQKGAFISVLNNYFTILFPFAEIASLNHSHKKQKDSLKTRAVDIENLRLC